MPHNVRKKITIMLSMDNGRKHPIIPIDHGNHLAVHPHYPYSRQYTITHIESGKKVRWNLPRFVALRMLELLDGDSRWKKIMNEGKGCEGSWALNRAVALAQQNAEAEYLLTEDLKRGKGGMRDAQYST